MEKWAVKELSQADLGDVRRNKRLIRIVEDLAAQPDSSVPLSCGNMAATKAAYNFWQKLIPPEIQVVIMGDSEADIFDLFSLKRPENSHLLIRGTHDRKVDHCAVAWRLLWLTYSSRVNPDLPCDAVLEKSEWQSLCATINKNPIPPKNPPSLRDAVRMIATLGGFLDRKGDGEPGVKTIWRGLRCLHDIAATWQLLHSGSPSHVYI